ncbi:hypothetical protein ABZP36_017927 [Zizania latifolia]
MVPADPDTAALICVSSMVLVLLRRLKFSLFPRVKNSEYEHKNVNATEILKVQMLVGIARTRGSYGFSQVAFILAAVAFISLLVSSSTVSARLLAAGSFVMSKKAMFVLSNAIFLFLAADCCCFSSLLSPFTGDFTAREQHSDVLDKQDQVGAELCATESCVPCSEIAHHDNDSSEGYAHDERKADDASEIRGDVAMSSQPGPFRLDEENSIVLEKVVIEEPTCGRAQELEELAIDELNKRFEEFIQSRRIRWEKEAHMPRQQEEPTGDSSIL